MTDKDALAQTAVETVPFDVFRDRAASILSNPALSRRDRVNQVNDLANKSGVALDQVKLDEAAINGDAAFLQLDASAEVGEIVVYAHRTRDDHRVRISAYNRYNAKEKEQIYGPNDRTSNILEPLWHTDGLIFPYTPSIQVSQDTSWQSADLEHTNYDILSFQRSSSASISITGKFTVQNQREGRYLLAAIHFLRTVSKAYFGARDVEKFTAKKTVDTGAATEQTPQEVSDEAVVENQILAKAGLPPPVLLFSGYGDYMFNDLRVVIKSHSWTYDEQADLIEIVLPTGGKVWLPPMMAVNITLAIQSNTDRLRETFNLDEFRTGSLLKKGGWF